MTVEQTNVSAPLVVNRWRRYGHDYAYVNVGADKLGYRDLATGFVHCTNAANNAAVAMATQDLYERASEARRASEYRPKHSADEAPAPAKELEPDRDLALNQPGQAVREVARELRDAAPVKTFFSRVVGAKTDERAHRIGADGEVAVARLLDKLGDGWHVLHSVPVGNRGSDIDHVVIGLGGVFTINTKNHPAAKIWVHGDTVKVNDFHQPYVRNSRHEAQRAGTLLSAATGITVTAHGVIAFVSAQAVTIKSQPAGVLVARRSDMIEHLRDAPAVLSPETVETIFAAARWLSTWQPKRVFGPAICAYSD